MYVEAKTQLYTLRDLLRFAVSRFNEAGLFFGHGSVSAYDEAAYLILHTLHLPLDRLEPFLDARLTATELEQVLGIIERRATEKIPAAYLTNEAWLGDFSFYVDERVIVPRSFIAELLRGQLAPWIETPGQIKSALDLCTGSGCLAILLAYAFPNATIDAVDISAGALEVAQKKRGGLQPGARGQSHPIGSFCGTRETDLRSHHQQSALCQRGGNGGAARGILPRTRKGAGKRGRWAGSYADHTERGGRPFDRAGTARR